MAAQTLPFLPDPAKHDFDAPALRDDTSPSWLSYGNLDTQCRLLAPFLDMPQRGLAMCCLPRTIEGVQAYLSAVKAGHGILLTDPDSPALQEIVQTYAPEWIIAPTKCAFDGYRNAHWPLTTLALFKKNDESGHTPLHPDFFMMLLTSGSTGSGKGVRLSYNNVASNVDAIIESLDLDDKSNALGHMPLSYSFGLSVLHCQLAIGGRCLLTEESMMSGGFWRKAREAEVSLFAGVPYHYEMMMRLGLARVKIPSMTTFLQAGGKMQLPLTQKLLEEVRQRDHGKLFIMYGQTEASPRISCLPLHHYPDKIGSSGKALQGGTLALEDGEIVYQGPNVMMGQAACREDLALGDIMKGRLATGDLGTLDDDGYLTITGRKQRFAKLFGQRVSLDDLEKIAAPHAFAVAIEQPEKVVILCLNASESTLEHIRHLVVEKTRLPAPWIDMRSVCELPRKASGKIDYQEIRKAMEAA
jgi:acyl-CoA synthetase (AMP-forming)/AMP-acid ligase II